MSVREPGWGGARPGAGRPKGSGADPARSRRNRIPVMVTDGDLEKLLWLAQKDRVPLATWAYRALSDGLASRRGPPENRGGNRK